MIDEQHVDGGLIFVSFYARTNVNKTSLCQKEAEQIDPEVIPMLVAILNDRDKLLSHALGV